MISASAVPRVLACPGSAVLPQHDYRTTYAEAGHDRHAEQEAAAGARADLHPAVEALLLPGDVLAAEAAFAYDVATGEGRGLGHIARQYRDLAPYEIPGTVDLVIHGNDRIIIVDYKGFEEVEPADSNAQTLTYALMVARAAGVEEVTVVIVYLVGGRRPSVATLGPLDLDAHAARLKQMQFDVARAAQNPDAATRLGKHCKYCPAFLFCEKQSQLRLDIASQVITMRVEGAIPFANDGDATEAFDLLGRIKMLTARLTAALYARAAERPIPLSNGKLFGKRTKLGDTVLNADIAYEVVREKHGQGIADAAVTRKASQAGIKRALELVAGKGEITALAKEVLKDIKARGGTKQDEKEVIEEYDAEPLLRAANE